MKKWIAIISLGIAILAIVMANAETKPDLAPSDVKITIKGGPVFNEWHEVVGINVGVRLHRMGLSASPTGFAVIVPASTVCKPMARV